MIHIMSKEKYVEGIRNDPYLLGRDLCCAGISPSSEEHPLGKGEIVGIQVSYCTFDENGNIVEDRSGNNSPFRGCMFREHDSTCRKVQAKLICPVAGVETIGDFNFRISLLKGLEDGNPNKKK